MLPNVTKPAIFNDVKYRYKPLNTNANSNGLAGHPCLIPLEAVKGADRPDGWTTETSPTFMAEVKRVKKGLLVMPI